MMLTSSFGLLISLTRSPRTGDNKIFFILKKKKSFRIQHKNKITPYLGKTLRGVVQKTILGGHEIYNRSKGFLGEPSGQIIVNLQNFENSKL